MSIKKKISNLWAWNSVGRSGEADLSKLIELYIRGGRIPWSEGYMEFRWSEISRYLSAPDVPVFFNLRSLPPGFGVGLDERIAEYPWIVNKIANRNGRILDAGSTFNYKSILDVVCKEDRELTIFTYHPESNCFNNRKINYVYGDLRDMLFRDGYFDIVISQSTIEHIDMDNGIYGYKGEGSSAGKSYEYLKAIREMLRVLKSGGLLLITFPFGRYEDHGFFQQFDKEMLRRIIEILSPLGKHSVDFFKYEPSSWRFAEEAELGDVVSFNPHTGRGKGHDGAAHCRGICCIEFIKDKA